MSKTIEEYKKEKVGYFKTVETDSAWLQTTFDELEAIAREEEREGVAGLSTEQIITAFGVKPPVFMTPYEAENTKITSTITEFREALKALTPPDKD